MCYSASQGYYPWSPVYHRVNQGYPCATDGYLCVTELGGYLCHSSMVAHAPLKQGHLCVTQLEVIVCHIYGDNGVTQSHLIRVVCH